MGVNRKEGEGSGRKEGMEGKGRERDYQMFEILTANVLCSANMRHHSKFCADRSNQCEDMAVFSELELSFCL